MRAVGSEDWGTHESADLCSAQRMRSARACSLLQRVGGAIPPLVPPLHCPRASCYSVAARECGEAASSVVRSILEEDVMLGLGAEVRHGCVESEPADRSASGREGGLDGAERDLSHASLPHTCTNSSDIKTKACIS